MFNTPLAIKVLANIEESQREPDEVVATWGQRSWGRFILPDSLRNRFGGVPSELGREHLDALYDDQTGLPIGQGSCGTAMCFAGWALSVQRVRMFWEFMGEGQYDAQRVANEDGTRSDQRVSDAAAEMLGIEKDSADWPPYDPFPLLFNADNTLDDLYRLVARMAGMTEDTLRVEVEAERVEQGRQREARIVASVNRRAAIAGQEAH